MTSQLEDICDNLNLNNLWLLIMVFPTPCRNLDKSWTSFRYIGQQVSSDTNTRIAEFDSAEWESWPAHVDSNHRPTP